MSQYNNKHVFLSEASSPHTLNLILNLIDRKIIEKSELLLILYKKHLLNVSIESACKNQGISTLNWDEVKQLKISFRTLNPLSLLSWNAEIVFHCIEHEYVDPECINILMQDDEIDRWRKLYLETGVLQVSKAAYIDNNTLKILSLVNNYVIPYSPWGRILEEILDREINIIDAVLPYSPLDYSSQSILESYITSRKNFRPEEIYKIMLFTKPIPGQDTIELMRAIGSYVIKNKNAPKNKKVILSLWLNSSRKVQLMYIGLMRLIKLYNYPIHIELIRKMNHGQYFLTLHDHDCLILQKRGGMSTAKYFAEKVGKVVTIEGSLNNRSFKEDYCIQSFSYKNLETALSSTINSIGYPDNDEIRHNSQLIQKRHIDSFNTLKEYWKKF